MEREQTVEAPATPRPSENDKDYERLFEECAPIAFRSAYAVLRSEADAEDVAQDALLTVFERVRTGAEIDDIGGYVHRTAYHAALRALGRARREVPLQDDAASKDDPSIEGLNRSRLITQATGVLSPLQREALRLFHQEGYSQAEVAEALDLRSEEAARKQISRAETRVFHRYVELLGERPGRQAGCQAITRLIGMELRGELKDGRAREELKAHLAACAFCRQTEEEASLGRQLAGLLPLPPIDGIMARKSEVIRALRSQAPRATPVAHTLALSHLVLPIAAAISATAIVTTALVVRGQTARPAAPPPVAVASAPSQASAPRAAAALPVSAKNPCAPSQQGGLAYISRREVFYRSSPNAAPVQVTHTGGRVDAFAWRPDGKALAYLQGAEWSADGTGTVYVVTPAGGDLGKLADSVSGFAYAPDGTAIVLVRPSYDARTKSQNGYTVQVVPVAGSSARDIGAPSSVSPTPDPIQKRWDLFWLGYVPTPVKAPTPSIAPVFPDTGIWWMEDGIYMQGLGVSSEIDPATGNITPRLWIYWQEHVLNQGPPAALLALTSGSVVSSCPGSSTTLLAGSPQSYPLQLNVSADGASGLATIRSVGSSDLTADIYLFTADGGKVQLTTDGASSMALWQPVIARGERE